MAQVKRIGWVDYTKLFACILVVLGHFFQSMTMSDILPNNNLYEWFNTTIYYFHVPLFFICSGFLYQQFSKINSFDSWRSNIFKKLLALGIPYFVFSTITWVLKTVFSGSVNTDLNAGLLKTLFVQPIAPYWYLYALFFVFLITPTFNTKSQTALIVIISVAFKGISFFVECPVVFIKYILIYEIWFVLGMILSKIKFTEMASSKDFIFGVILSVLFFVLSVFAFTMDLDTAFIGFGLGVVACVGVILICVSKFNNKCNAITRFSAKYTMPIYLMHTIFAAPLRSLLLKVGINNWVIHVVLGLAISFIGPIIAELIICRFKFLEFFLYPTKVLKGRKKLCQPKN